MPSYATNLPSSLGIILPMLHSSYHQFTRTARLPLLDSWTKKLSGFTWVCSATEHRAGGPKLYRAGFGSHDLYTGSLCLPAILLHTPTSSPDASAFSYALATPYWTVHPTSFTLPSRLQRCRGGLRRFRFNARRCRPAGPLLPGYIYRRSFCFHTTAAVAFGFVPLDNASGACHGVAMYANCVTAPVWTTYRFAHAARPGDARCRWTTATVTTFQMDILRDPFHSAGRHYWLVSRPLYPVLGTSVALGCTCITAFLP